MTKSPFRKFLILVLGLALGAIAWIGPRILELRQELKAKSTASKMLELAGVLATEQPLQVSSEDIRPLLPKYNRQGSLRDDWGNDLVVERIGDGQQTLYRIRSLGRDGVQGACCKLWIASWDGDAVLEGDRWLQVWYPKGARAEVPGRSKP